MRRFILTVIILLIIGGVVWIYYYLDRSEKSSSIVLYGNVDVRQVDLGFRVSGRVVSMPYQEGDLIQPGTLMAKLDHQPYLDLVNQARASVDSARTSLSYTKKVLERRKALLDSEDGSVSVEDFESALSNYEIQVATQKQAEANLGVALTNLNDTQVFAPSEGVILTRVREPGTVVREGDPVYTLSLTSPVWIRAYISEPYLGVVTPGMYAEVFTDTKNGSVYKGHVGFISPVAEFTPKTVQTTELRTDLVYRIRVIVDNPDQGLRQGMPVTVKLYPSIEDHPQPK